ncbi:tyrosine-type recombinase/integrase [Roseburia sp. 831b]|uniref:tyrosine-type recombinase/integrase n=1 Tax=Roseburia sp. 831b TaxID=1261635 RepID=UPI0009527C9E|nr:tyrosine-type recombinase/integrase [Roseburia sp. 831b]WVK74238.1 tyrosine-type recombinase/integrase [Roseburia sp. 831b]
MTKTELINDVVFCMTGYLTNDGIDRLKNIITVKLMNINLTASETLPSNEVYNNDWILKRYIIDLTATGRKQSTINLYIIIIKKFFEETRLNYHTCTGQDVMDYIALRLYRDKISKAYASTIQRYMSAFFSWAYRKKHIEEDVARDIDKIKAPQKRKERLSDEEIVKASLTISNDLRLNALFELMLSAGPRVGEISNLKIENLDFQRKEVRILGEKTSQWRTCFMTERCKQALQVYIGERSAGPVFVGKRGLHVALSRNTIEAMAKEIAVAGGCKFNATVHSFRKTFASREYRRTNDILYVSKRLGHSSTDVTMRYYICDDVELDRTKANTAA